MKVRVGFLRRFVTPHRLVIRFWEGPKGAVIWSHLIFNTGRWDTWRYFTV